jgi:hypothetical protein
VQAFFGVDAEREPERARRIYDSHLERATSLSELPERCVGRSKLHPAACRRCPSVVRL